MLPTILNIKPCISELYLLLPLLGLGLIIGFAVAGYHFIVKVSSHMVASTNIDILDVFHSPQTNHTEAVRFAKWNRFSGLVMLEKLDIKNRDRGLMGRQIRAVAFLHKPYSILTFNNGTLRVTGYMKHLFDGIMGALNLRYIIRQVPPEYGIGLPDGTYSGFVGILNRKEADVSMNVLAMTNTRIGGIAYTGPVTKGSLVVAYMQPDAVLPPTAYLLPFSASVWLCVILSVVVFMTALAVVMVLSPSTRRNPTTAPAFRSTLRWLLTGTFFQEALNDSPGFPEKIVYGALMFAVMGVFIHYTSVFTSFLTHLEVKVPFSNMEELLPNYDYRLMYTSTTRHEDFFKNTNEQLFRKMWVRLQQESDGLLIYDFELGLNLLKRGGRKRAYLTEGPTTFYLAALNCSIAIAPQQYLREFFYMTARPDFPYSRMLGFTLLKFMEGGLFRRLLVTYNLGHRTPCVVENTSNSLGFDQVASLFVLTAIGFFLALLVFVGERTVLRRCSTYRRKIIRIQPTK